MSVRKIFWEDPYLTQLTTSVNSVEGNVITLNETIFYAFSGGQHSDDGYINTYKVLLAKKEGKEIYYTIDKNHTLKSGDTVVITIDWDKRYKLIRLHFAVELILELVNQHYNKPVKIGANITDKKGRLDFIWQNDISEMFPLLEAEFSKLVNADLPIVSDFSNREEEIRFWEIKGFAKVPCGGTHPKSTGEIGRIRLNRDRQGKNKERIEIFLI